MNELIKIDWRMIGEKTVDAVSAKDLYAGLGLSSAHWAKWADANIVKNDFFIVGRDWEGITQRVNGNETMDYAITLEFAKHMAMMAKTEKAHDYRNYFIECERKTKQQIAIPLTYLEALEALIISERAKSQLAIELDQSKQWYSIKRVAQINGRSWKEFSWNKLKAASVVTGFPSRKIFDANYGEVNTYHKAAWDAAYPGLTIEGDAE